MVRCTGGRESGIILTSWITPIRSKRDGESPGTEYFRDLPMLRIALLGCWIVIPGAMAQVPVSDLATLNARARMPYTLGHEDAGFGELYEFNTWLLGDGPSEARLRRTGAPPFEPVRHDGLAPYRTLPGRYALLLHQPEWFVRAKVVPDISLQAGQTLELNVIPAMDYCVVSGTSLAPFQKEGVEDPWDWARVFHQTFVARGSSITHVHYKLAGTRSRSTCVSIHEVRTGTQPEGWRQIGPERIDPEVGALNDNWVGWRSGEVPTTPGKTYAIRIEGAPDGDNDQAGLGMLVHRDAVGPGYVQGTGYADGREMPYDMYASVSSDSDGTVIPYMRVHDIKPGKLLGWGTYAQTWKARGRSLAAVDFLVAWAGDMDGVTTEVRVRQSGPKGKVIGIAKRTHTAWWGPGHGWLGAAWRPGEVPLEPGETYYVEFAPADGCKGYSGSGVNHPANRYPDGMAWRDGRPLPEEDLELTVVEYKDDGQPPKRERPYRPRGTNLVHNGGFEDGHDNESDAEAPPGWEKWMTRPTAFWYGAYGRNRSKAGRVIGGSINGTTIDGGFVQRVSGLDADQRYTLTGWASTSVPTDARCLAAIGYDPTGQTDNPKADTITWGLLGRDSRVFEQVVFHDIRPRGEAISVWTRGHNSHKDVGIFTVDFDAIALVRSRPGN